MKVLLVSANFYTAEGALARAIVDLCPEIEFYYFRAHDMRGRFREFLDLIHKVDVVHWIMNLSNIDFPEDFNPYTLPCPSIATVHHLMKNESNKIEFAEKADLIHAVSEPWAAIIEKMTRTPVSLACGGVDYKKLSSHQKIKSPAKVFRFGMFGVAHSRKRVDFFLEGLSRLENKNFEVVFQGEHWNTHQRKFQQKGIRARFLGSRSYESAWKAYGKIDCYVCSSEVEGGPLGILEALSSGVPVVSTNIGMATALLRLGGGIKTDVHDADDFAAGLRKMMSDGEFYAKCVKEAAMVAAEFCKGLPQDYREMYRRVTEIWDKKHDTPWVFKPVGGPQVFLQRKRELVHDRLAESADLIKSGHLIPGFWVWGKAFWNGQVSFILQIKYLRYALFQFLKRKYRGEK